VILDASGKEAPQYVTDELGWSSEQLIEASNFSPNDRGGYDSTPTELLQFFTDYDKKLKEVSFVIPEVQMFTKFYTQTDTDLARIIDPGKMNEIDRRKVKTECARFFWPATFIRHPGFQKIFWKQLPPRHVIHNPTVSCF